MLAFINSIAGQIVILLALAVLLMVSGLYIYLSVAREPRLPPPVILLTHRQIGLAEVMSQLKPENRNELLEKLRQRKQDVTYQFPVAPEDLAKDLKWRNSIDRSFDENSKQPRPQPTASNPSKFAFAFARKVEAVGEEQFDVSFYFRFEDGQILGIHTNIVTSRPPDRVLPIAVGFVILCTILLLVWAIFFLVYPLRSLAQVTNKIAKDSAERYPAKVIGPTEVRTAAKALNKMQERIHHHIEDRTRMLAAVSHDLRTPVTRLRLRADTVQPEDVKAAMLRDLGHMDGLLSRLMTYFSKGKSGEKWVSLELSSVVDSLADKWSDAGYAVSAADNPLATIKARPNDLIRLLENLIDNAVKYAGGCEVTLSIDDGYVHLNIIDHGPGIAEENRAALIEPFARGDEARTMDEHSGFGLGLAIARQVVESHEATLTMSDTEGGGLTITIIFAQERS